MAPVSEHPGIEPKPDHQDWTWTLSRRCEDCGLSAGEVNIADISDRAAVAAAEWVQILLSSPAVSWRPEPDVWSPLEYGAHVRDVFAMFDRRLGLMLSQDNPTFENWDQNQTALASRYADEDPDQVAAELRKAADSFLARISEVDPDQLGRRGQRSDGSEFTVRTLLQYFLHDVIHHLWDVTGQQDGVESLV